MRFEEDIKQYAGQPITKQLLMDLLRSYRRPHDKISELVKQKMLIPVKRGIYIPGPDLKMPGPEKLLLGNHLWGPSYISSDTALSFWGMIPERVYEICSMTTNTAKVYKTSIGRFIFIKLPLPYYSFGLMQVEIAAKQTVLIAGKEKAICDKIITTPRVKLRSVKQTKEYLVEDLRIEKQVLRELNTALIKDWIRQSPKQESIKILYKTLVDL